MGENLRFPFFLLMHLYCLVGLKPRCYLPSFACTFWKDLTLPLQLFLTDRVVTTKGMIEHNQDLFNVAYLCLNMMQLPRHFVLHFIQKYCALNSKLLKIPFYWPKSLKSFQKNQFLKHPGFENIWPK